MKMTLHQLLISCLLYSALTQAVVLPIKQKGKEKSVQSTATSSNAPAAADGFKWSVSSFREIENKPNSFEFKRESSDRYLDRIEKESASSFELSHSLHPDIHRKTAHQLEADIHQDHSLGKLSDDEFQVYRNNLLVKIRGRELVENGHAVKIGHTVHHPNEMHPAIVASDYKFNKMAKMLMHKVPEVRNQYVHAMMLLSAPPKYSSKVGLESAATNLHPVKVESNEYQAETSQRHDKNGKAAAAAPTTTQVPHGNGYFWLVTTQRPRENNNHGNRHFHTESIQQYRQRSLKKGAEDREKGKHDTIYGYNYTPHPTVQDPDNSRVILPRIVQQMKENGYTINERILIRHNMEQLSKSWQFINNGGIVSFPDSIHHPRGTNAFDALYPQKDIKVGQMKVFRTTNIKKGTNYKLQFEPSMSAAGQQQQPSQPAANPNKDPREESSSSSSSNQNLNQGTANKKQRSS